MLQIATLLSKIKHPNVRGKGTHQKQAPRNARGKGIHKNKAIRNVRGKGTYENKAPQRNR